MKISYDERRLFMVERVSLCFIFERISRLNSDSSFWRVSRPASEKDFRYWKKALNFTYYDLLLKMSYFIDYIVE